MKKYEFWAYGVDLILLLPTYFLGCLIIIICGIIPTFYLNLVIIGISFIAILIIMIFSYPRMLAKIILTPDSITLKRFNKILVSIDWDDVIEIDEKFVTIGSKIPFIKSTNSKINLSPTKKLYNAIMDVCPYESFKHIFNELEAFKWYHRKRKNKKTGD